MIGIKTLAPAAMFFLYAFNAVAGSVSGIAVDTNGAPLAGVHVEVVYQTYRAEQLNNSSESVKEIAITDADGRYAISTDNLPPGEYAASAYRVSTDGGQQRNIDLVAEDSSTFPGNADTLRNFTASLVESSEEQPYGNAGVFVLNNAIADFTDLSGAEVTLVNTASGETFVKTVRPTGEGLVVTGIPFATYRASVRLNGRPLQIKLWGPNESDDFTAEVVHDFSMGYMGNQIQVAARP